MLTVTERIEIIASSAPLNLLPKVVEIQEANRLGDFQQVTDKLYEISDETSWGDKCIDLAEWIFWAHGTIPNAYN